MKFAHSERETNLNGVTGLQRSAVRACRPTIGGCISSNFERPIDRAFVRPLNSHLAGSNPPVAPGSFPSICTSFAHEKTIARPLYQR